MAAIDERTGARWSDAPGNTGRTARLAAAERRIATAARILDDLVTLPGTRRRFGLDSVIGLIPGVGDLATAAVGLWIVAESARFRLPRIVIVRMVLNTAADLVIGLIPVIGDLADFVFTSNTRNLELFRRHARDPGASTTGHRLFVAGLALVVVGIGWLLVSAIVAILSVEIAVPRFGG